MAVASAVSITVQFTGEVTYTQQFSVAANASASGENLLTNLASGANTITPPTSATTGCIIIPPIANATAITFKGVTGDTGLRLHNTNPSFITLNSGSSTFCLTAAAGITGLRIIWT